MSTEPEFVVPPELDLDELRRSLKIANDVAPATASSDQQNSYLQNTHQGNAGQASGDVFNLIPATDAPEAVGSIPVNESENTVTEVSTEPAANVAGAGP